jgi:APA family basic amino acid/polyamine antiporter
MMPRAGGQYVYLREAFSPLWGFLYGWTSVPRDPGRHHRRRHRRLLPLPRRLGATSSRRSATSSPPSISPPRYALSLSTTQLIALLVIAFLTWTNTRGLKWGKWIQNVFTSTKTLALAGTRPPRASSAAGTPGAIASNFGDLWTIRGASPTAPGLAPDSSLFGLFVALVRGPGGLSLRGGRLEQHHVYRRERSKTRGRTFRSLWPRAAGVFVIGLYLLANLASLVTLPFDQIQHAPSDRVATSTLEVVLPGKGALIMAVGIIISTFGCANGLILSGARATYAMAKDGVFFKAASRLNASHVPAWALVLQGVWACLLVLPRTFDPATGAYGNLYSNLLDYVISAALLFYILTILGLFRLRLTRPDAERPYRALGYPWVPALYIAAASVLLVMLFVYRNATTWPGFAIVALGVPVYFMWGGSKVSSK